MQKSRVRVLTVGLSAEELVQIAPSFDRQHFELDRFPSLSGAAELVACQQVDVLLARYTRRGMKLLPFLRAVRAKESPCRHSLLLLVVPRPEDLTPASGYVGRGVNRIVPLHGNHQGLPAMISEMLRVAPRVPCQVIAQLGIRAGRQRDWVLCRTRNGSSSGLLVETERRIPTGTKVDFELSLPAMDQPVVGRAEVTRQTRAEREAIHGFGMRFLSFAGDSRSSYEAYLSARTS